MGLGRRLPLRALLGAPCGYLQGLFGHLGAFLARLGGLLGASWRPLGPSWRHLEASWGHLGASWTYLGALKAILEASWRRLGPPKSTDSVNAGRGGGIAAATPEGYPEGLGYWERVSEGIQIRKEVRVNGLCTPCAGRRPGAADPTCSKAAYPPPRELSIL